MDIDLVIKIYEALRNKSGEEFLEEEEFCDFLNQFADEVYDVEMNSIISCREFLKYYHKVMYRGVKFITITDVEITDFERPYFPYIR